MKKFIFFLVAIIFVFTNELEARWYDPKNGRFISEDPIGFEGGDVNLYTYTENNPVNYTDPLGLATFMCEKPLDFLVPLGGGTTGRKSYTNAPSNPLYHQYICIQRGGRIICGGQTSYSPLFGRGKFYAPGFPSDDKYYPERCEEKVADNDCIEKCLLKKFVEKRPYYGFIGPGTNCQEWANNAVFQCQQECGK